MSEPNLWSNVYEEARQIPGHKVYLHATMNNMNHAIIVLIARSELTVHIMNLHMDQETATIWARIGSRRKNSIVIGGIYREHLQLGRGETHDCWMEKQIKQIWRWNFFLLQEVEKCWKEQQVWSDWRHESGFPKMGESQSRGRRRWWNYFRTSSLITQDLGQTRQTAWLIMYGQIAEKE